MIKGQRLKQEIAILSDLGFKINKNFRILDFGCGDEKDVKILRNEGYKAYGCDIEFKEKGKFFQKYYRQGIIRKIQISPYKIPFSTNSFDLILSNQVFEHIMDYQVVFKEIKRVLKNGGISLHVFPSKGRLIEPHIFVPLTGRFQNKWWLRFWAAMGIRNQFQKDLSVDDIVQANDEYLKTNTNYLTRKEIEKIINKDFQDWKFVEKVFLKNDKRLRSRILYYISFIFPFIPSIYSDFLDRVLFFRK